MCQEEPGKYISNVLVRPKPNNKFRLILDLNHFYDAFITCQLFKMHSLQTAIDLISRGLFFTSIDLSDAYYTVRVSPEHKKCLLFMWENSLLQFTSSKWVGLYSQIIYEASKLCLCLFQRERVLSVSTYR